MSPAAGFLLDLVARQAVYNYTDWAYIDVANQTQAEFIPWGLVHHSQPSQLRLPLINLNPSQLRRSKCSSLPPQSHHGPPTSGQQGLIRALRQRTREQLDVHVSHASRGATWC